MKKFMTLMLMAIVLSISTLGGITATAATDDLAGTSWSCFAFRIISTGSDVSLQDTQPGAYVRLQFENNGTFVMNTNEGNDTGTYQITNDGCILYDSDGGDGIEGKIDAGYLYLNFYEEDYIAIFNQISSNNNNGNDNGNNTNNNDNASRNDAGNNNGNNANINNNASENDSSSKKSTNDDKEDDDKEDDDVVLGVVGLIIIIAMCVGVTVLITKNKNKKMNGYQQPYMNNNQQNMNYNPQQNMNNNNQQNMNNNQNMNQNPQQNMNNNNQQNINNNPQNPNYHQQPNANNSQQNPNDNQNQNNNN